MSSSQPTGCPGRRQATSAPTVAKESHVTLAESVGNAQIAPASEMIHNTAGIQNLWSSFRLGSVRLIAQTMMPGVMSSLPTCRSGTHCLRSHLGSTRLFKFGLQQGGFGSRHAERTRPLTQGTPSAATESSHLSVRSARKDIHREGQSWPSST